MKLLKKILLITTVVIAVLGVTVLVFVRYISTSALPEYQGELKVKGLRAETRIIRDAQAMPHIVAKNEHDLYFATGYAMAQDRLWQMDLLRRVTMGRLSEIFGKDMVKTDYLLRALRMSKKSHQVLEQTPDSILLCINAFADGVNAFLAENGRNLPPEFVILQYRPEPWEPYHTVNLIGYMAWDLSGSWQNEIVLHQLRKQLPDNKWNELLPEFAFQQSVVHQQRSVPTAFSILEGNDALQELGIEIVSGSNNWAVGPQKSNSGKAMMANDMHLGFGAPGIWYPLHQLIEGRLNVTGVALPGAPCIINGHNDSIGWGMTNLYVDEMDFFIELPDSTKKNHYYFEGKSLPMDVVDVKIAVKGGDTVSRLLRFTHHGPIVSEVKEINEELISMRWTGNDYSNELRSVYLLNQAKNWNDFREALTTMLSVSQNVVFADVNGNIGLQTAGAVPVRKNGNGMLPVAGESGDYEWLGYLPFDSLPYTYNPPQAYVSSANNRTTDTNYKHFIGHWFDNSSRIDRIRELLEQENRIDPQYFMKMQGDQVSSFAAKNLSALTSTLSDSKELNPTQQQALQLLLEWDGNMAASLPQPAIFDQFYLQFMRLMLADDMGEEAYQRIPGGLMRHIFDRMWRGKKSAWSDLASTTEHQESFDEIVVMAFKASVNQLVEILGDDVSSWEWGKLHQLVLQHPLGKVDLLNRIFTFNRGPFVVGGSFHTVNPTAYNFHKPFAVVHGASQRHIFTMGNPQESYLAIPTGVSGIPASKYYCNQAADYIHLQYNRDHFNLGQLETAKMYELKLIPDSN